MDNNMDNTDYFESIGGNEEEMESGRCRVELLQRQICTRFEPFKEYFTGLPIARVLHSRPDFTPTISRNLRNYMQPDRQIKYLKGILPEDYCQEALEELLVEQEHHSIRKLRNTSAVVEDTLYWAELTTVKSVRVWDFIGKEKLQAGKELWTVGTASPALLIDLHEWIYELTAV
jgi:hypothetical protein